jgi:hypothetical protein
MKRSASEIEVGDGPLVTAAIHDGHEVRSDVAKLLALSDLDPLREEDPFTASLLKLSSTWISIGRRDRPWLSVLRQRI